MSKGGSWPEPTLILYRLNPQTLTWVRHRVHLFKCRFLGQTPGPVNQTLWGRGGGDGWGEAQEPVVIPSPWMILWQVVQDPLKDPATPVPSPVPSDFFKEVV